MNCNDIKVFCDNYFGLDISTRKRTLDICDMRKVYYMLCKLYIPSYGYNYIGKTIDRDHATVLSGYNKLKFLLERDFNDSCVHLFKHTEKAFLEHFKAMKDTPINKDTKTERILKMEKEIDQLKKRLKWYVKIVRRLRLQKKSLLKRLNKIK